MIDGKMKATRLSIIIPHFNIPHLLGRLLETVPILDEIQLIVIDDNSTENLDELSEVIKSSQRAETYAF